jgi:rubrerythrin
MRIISSTAELYAQTIAMEREAAARYSELAERMDDEGREDLARVFALLAGAEAEHLETLERRTRGIELPAVDPGAWGWYTSAAPETAARELIFRLMTPRQALAIALKAERRAQFFFEDLSWGAPDASVRALAHEMAIDERGHAALIAAMLEGMPESSLDSTVIFER